MKRLKVTIFLFLAVTIAYAAPPRKTEPNVNIFVKNGRADEHTLKTQLQEILDKYNLSRWIITDSVMIETGVRSHSHPVLTISTYTLDDPDNLLATFIHEQLHWFFYNERTQLLIDDLKPVFQNVPVGRPSGARSEFSTYLHLLVCFMEHKAMIELIGEEAAIALAKSHKHYTWIYKMVLEKGETIREILDKHNVKI